MGLSAALKDRARVKSQVPAPARVEGKTIMVDALSPWFRCRLELPSGSLIRDRTTEGGANRSRVVTSPTALVALRDETGERVKITARDRLIVESDELGVTEWEITADPAPLRKKKAVIGWNVSMQRVEDNAFVPRLP